MKNYIIIFFFFMSVVGLSSCKVSSCACPMTYENRDKGLESIEQNIKKTDIKFEQMTME